VIALGFEYVRMSVPFQSNVSFTQISIWPVIRVLHAVQFIFIIRFPYNRLRKLGLLGFLFFSYISLRSFTDATVVIVIGIGAEDPDLLLRDYVLDNKSHGLRLWS
jgi:hypothetical protein